MSGWPVKTLDEVLHRTETVNPAEKPGTEFEYVDVSAVSNETFQITETQRLKGKDAPSRARRLIRAEDVLFATVRPTLQRIAIVPPELDGQVCSTGYFVMRPKPGLDHRWLFYSLFTEGFTDQMQALQKGASYPAVNDSDVRAQKIALPPLAEQRRIVAILDEAFAAIATAKANTEQNLANACAVFESHRQAVLTTPGNGWIEKPLADLCDIKHGFAFKSEFFTEEGEYVLLTPGNFFESGGYRDRGDKQKYYEGEIPNGFVLAKGDLLVAMTEQAAGLLGSPILVPESNRFLHNQRLGLVQRKSGAPWVNEYFFHVFNLRQVRNAIHESGTGVKVRHTSPTKIGQVVVALPSSETEQRTIVQRLAKLDAETQRLESLAQQKLAALDALKASLLHHAFTGQLTAPKLEPGFLFAGFEPISMVELQAGIIAIAYRAHESKGWGWTFGHVKAEKVPHMAEAQVGIDLERRPGKHERGPADMERFHRVMEWAEKVDAFRFVQVAGKAGYTFVKGKAFDALVEKATKAAGNKLGALNRLIDIFVPLDTKHSEVFATVWAAWNNLLLDRRKPTDEDIVRAAREDWHKEKMNIPRPRFFEALGAIRKHGIQPDGTARRVAKLGQWSSSD